MEKRFRVLAFACALAAAAAAAEAQQVPTTGQNAVGFTVGASFPNDDALNWGVDLGVQAEHYFTPRASIRAKFSGPWFDIESRPFTGTVHPLALEGNAVYNWERGAWHPYVTGGLGWYHYRFEEADHDSSDNKFGLNLGGGAEYFMSRRDTLLGEFQLRLVPGRVHSDRSSYEPGYWTLAFGYKKYF